MLTDRPRSRIAHLFAYPKGPGGQWQDHRLMVGGILWIMETAAQWRDLPEGLGPWKTVSERFRRWRSDGTPDGDGVRTPLPNDAFGTSPCSTGWTTTGRGGGGEASSPA